MVDLGRGYFPASVAGWYDCGKGDTLPETNRPLPDPGRARAPKNAGPGVPLVPPVYIEDGVEIRNSTVGPNVSIEAGGRATDSTLAHSILGENTRVGRSTGRDSVGGDD